MRKPFSETGRLALRVAWTSLCERGFAGAVRLAYDRFNKLPLMEFGIRPLLLPFRVKHLSGPQRAAEGQADVIVISVVRNGALWIRSFLHHHRAKGVRHFVILDNGSTDRTVELLSNFADVTLLRTNAPYSAYENTMKRYLAKKYCSGLWCLCVDVDELFDYPGSDVLPLLDFLEYCDSNGYNAVVTQMLDMFSDVPLRDVRSSIDDDIFSIYRYYDITAIGRTPYLYNVPDDRIQMHRGGIRKAVFGTDNGLTKISLFRMDGVLKPFVQWHHAEGARIADVSTVLLHYPFVESFYAKVVDAVRDGRYGYLTSDEYALYLDSLTRDPEIRLKLSTASLLKDVNQLEKEGFLITSSRYRICLSQGR